ncbi:MAG: hypothetical protein JRE64_12550 [Deltaproteobacteria bacterium]|nr:hypothetical protein [Deltaproteobacteria bacterium]
MKLHDKVEGVLSGELARQLKRSPNALTNRLPGLERKGLIIRAKMGKNSLVYLTPKGKYVAEELSKSMAKTEAACDISAEKKPSEKFLNQFGQYSNEKPTFWICPTIDTHEGHNLRFLKSASQALTVEQPIPKSQIMTFESRDE